MSICLSSLLDGGMESVKGRTAAGRPLVGHTQIPIRLGLSSFAKPSPRPKSMAKGAWLATGKPVTGRRAQRRNCPLAFEGELDRF